MNFSLSFFFLPLFSIPDLLFVTQYLNQLTQTPPIFCCSLQFSPCSLYVIKYCTRSYIIRVFLGLSLFFIPHSSQKKKKKIFHVKLLKCFLNMRLIQCQRHFLSLDSLEFAYFSKTPQKCFCHNIFNLQV